ncbi:hypothetical protein ASG87_05700 [Frateuria sp. Soil773]|uniref:hypothetical protein n=1 Tax=Frateuria sp. Soil773 TaxID=1736407 RepID=UPI0006FA4350|nr:hypothetical protein [Frateuria sp. Soil773]KRE89040.1 hypothetical protein ASG87_05700 [Frateuria sp. Soil773]
MTSGHTSALDAQVAAWIDDLAAPERAVEGIVALGHAAVGPLSAYLDRGPQLVSQPRELAVRMLARLHHPDVVERLRRVLRDHPLRGLPPALAESEYRVKDAAVAGLAAQLGAAASDDLAFGVCCERLPSALRAAGRLRLHALAPSVARLLADDVLEDAAAEALHGLLPESASSVLTAIAAWLYGDADTPHVRLALIRAFLWLQAIAERPPVEICQQALRHPCVPVRAATALVMDGAAPTDADAVAEALAHGALGTDERLAMACRERLRSVPNLPIEPLVRALRADEEADVYDNTRYPNPTARRILLDIILAQAGGATEKLRRIVRGVPPDDLAEALFRWHWLDAPWLESMLGHPVAQVRLAATACLLRYPLPARQRWLAERLGDRDRRIRHKAFTILAALIDARQASLSSADLPSHTLWLAPWACLRLLARSTRIRR